MFVERTCVTNDLERLPGADRPRRCLQKVFDEQVGRWVPAHYASCADPDSCRGCVPRVAEHGYLCRSCHAKTVDALARVAHLIVHLRSISKEPQALGERVDTSMEKSIIVPDSWLAADGLVEALGAPPIPSTAGIDATFQHVNAAVGEWGDVDRIIDSREGAKRAVVLVKRMRAALTRWPDSEVNWRHVPLILCPNCYQPTLYRRGPLDYRDDLLVQCAGSNLMYEQGIGYDECEFALDWFMFVDTYQAPIAAAFKIHTRRKP